MSCEHVGGPQGLPSASLPISWGSTIDPIFLALSEDSVFRDSNKRCATNFFSECRSRKWSPDSVPRSSMDYGKTSNRSSTSATFRQGQRQSASVKYCVLQKSGLNL